MAERSSKEKAAETARVYKDGATHQLIAVAALMEDAAREVRQYMARDNTDFLMLAGFAINTIENAQRNFNFAWIARDLAIYSAARKESELLDDGRGGGHRWLMKKWRLPASWRRMCG